MDITSLPELALAVYRESNDAFFVIRLSDQIIVDVNPTALRLTEHPKRAILERCWTDFIQSDLPQQMDDLLHTFDQTGNVHSREGYTLTARGGRKLPVSLSACRIHLPDQALGLLVVRDVSDRKRAEETLKRAGEELENRVQERLAELQTLNEKLRESEQRCRLTFQSAPISICLLDADDRILQVNAQFCKIVGYSEEDCIGRTINDFAHADDVDISSKGLRTDANASIGFVTDERRYVRKDGSICWVRQTDSPVERENSERHCLRMIEDISDHKRTEEEFARLSAKVQYAQKLESLGVLAGGIAHDFNNLLTAIIGNAELALDRLTPLSPAREEIEQIQSVAKRAAELCKQMLAYSGKGKFVLREVHLSKLLRELEHLLRLSVGGDVVIKYNLTLDIPLIECDVNQIRQLFLNLVTNASEAIGDGSGVVTITTGVQSVDRTYLLDTYLDEELPEGQYVYGEVSDTGCGMNEETISRLFDPFFTTKFPGRGLGLAAVLGIVRGHQGAIKVYSHLGKGTTIKILFPACKQANASETPNPYEAGPVTQRRGKLMVVDDEPTVRSLVQRVMERRGFTVLCAFDGPNAVQLFRENPDDIAIILLDMTMPQMSGEEVFRELRRIRPDVRVVLSSGYNEEDATSRFAGKGLAGFLQKPYTPATLWETLEQALNLEAEPRER